MQRWATGEGARDQLDIHLHLRRDPAGLQRREADRLPRRRVAPSQDLGLPARDHLHGHRVRRHRPRGRAEPRRPRGGRARPRAGDGGLVQRDRARARRDPRADARGHSHRLHHHLRRGAADHGRVRADQFGHRRRRRRAARALRGVGRLRRGPRVQEGDADLPGPRGARGADGAGRRRRGGGRRDRHPHQAGRVGGDGRRQRAGGRGQRGGRRLDDAVPRDAHMLPAGRIWGWRSSRSPASSSAPPP